MKAQPFPLLFCVMLTLSAVLSSAEFLGSLDELELDAVKYGIVIEGKPVKQGEEDLMLQKSFIGTTPMAMTNKFGQRFRCLLPDITKEEEELEDSKRLERERGATSDPAEFANLVKLALSPMECLVSSFGWWEYQFCHGDSLKQYHSQDGQIVGPVQSLGNFVSDREWSEADLANDAINYHSQFYDNGTVCDITGRKRKTEVKFHCDADSYVDAVVAVEEPLSCEYVVHVSTPRLCSLAKFRPPPSNKPKEIRCSPVLDESQYDNFLQSEKERNILLEKKRREQKEKRKRQMLEALSPEVAASIDADTDEGYMVAETLFQEQMAKRLVTELEHLLSPSNIQQFEAAASNPGGIFVHNFMSLDGEDRRQSYGRVDRDEYERVMTTAAAKVAAKSEAAKRQMEILQSIERKVRSDAYTEKDLIEEFVEDSEKGQRQVLENARSPEFMSEVRRELEESLDDVIAETERETGVKLNAEARREVEEGVHSLKSLFETLERMEKKITDVNKEISKVSELMDKKEQEIDELSEGDDNHFKHDNKLSVKKELRNDDGEVDDAEELQEQQLGGDEDGEHVVRVHVADMTPGKVSGLGDSAEKVARRLENMIRSKLSRSDLDTGGRQIEIKLITATTLVDDEDLDDASEALRGMVTPSSEAAADAEAQQFQSMIYNLMTGNQEAFEEIDSQRKTERNYKFIWGADEDREEKKTSSEEA